MKKLILLALLVLVALSVVWVGFGRPGATGRRLATPRGVAAARAALDTPVAAKLIAADNDLALRLLAALWKKHPNTNICVCPVAVSQLLHLSRLGAAGSTGAEFDRILGSGGARDTDVANFVGNLQTVASAPDPYVKASIADCFWVDRTVSLKTDYADLVKTKAAVEIRSVDLGTPAARAEITQWFRDHTSGKLGSAGLRDEPGTAIALTNAVYFKGTWKDRFDRSLTKEAEFTCFDGKKRKLPMMNLKTQFACNWHSGGLPPVVRLPYGNGVVAMVAFLPNGYKGIQEVIDQLQADKWSDLMHGFGQPVPSTLIFPRFKADWSADLVPILRAMGLKEPFNSAGKADFSKLTAIKPFWVQSIAQSTTISVDEDGTEAAAAVEEHGSCGMPGTMDFNRPFVYAIVDDSTGVILFLGVFGNP